MTKASDQYGFDIYNRLVAIATRAELVERLRALSPEDIARVTSIEPTVYAEIGRDAREAADYLRGLADDFEDVANKLGAAA